MDPSMYNNKNNNYNIQVYMNLLQNQSSTGKTSKIILILFIHHHHAIPLWLSSLNATIIN
jgi:hypothetical protein